MSSKKTIWYLESALCELISEWAQSRNDKERSEEVIRQYNQLINLMMDWGWNPYVDGLDVTSELPDELMSKRYLLAIKSKIPLNHKGYE